MDELLQSPLFQSVIVPFMAALIVTELFQRMRLSGLAVIVAFFAALFFTNDFVIWPLTATRKLIIASLLSAALGLWLDSARKLPRPVEMIVAALAAALATLWVLWPAFMQVIPDTRWYFAGGMVAFVVWTTLASLGLHNDSVRASAAGWGLGIGTGLAAWMGSSDLLGKFGVAVAMASAAYLFIQGMSGLRLPAGRIYVVPAGLIAGLVAATAVTLGKLPWIILPVLALIPLLARIPFGKTSSVRIQSLIISFVVLIPAVAAVFFLWQHAGNKFPG
ncbi:MAG: hypothetical protein WCE88_03390 [Burkholderiales bacterium]